MPIYSKIKTFSKEYEKSKNEYADYIDNHISNVRKCYKLYSNKLMEECNNLNINLDLETLINLIDTHDESKFDPCEFEPYRQYFYTINGETKDKDKFEIGWLHHQNKNPHHPEYWVCRDDKEYKILDMPIEYICEMLLDWAAMGLKFNNTAYSYYEKAGKTKPFSENTRIIVDHLIKIFK